MKTIQPARLLKLALYADAAASLTLAALQLLLPSRLTEQLSLPAALLTETGFFLVAYALTLVCLASMRRVWAGAVQIIIVGNVGWAVACLALAGTPILSPSGLGITFLAFQAIAVLLFALLEYTGLQQSTALPVRDQLSAAP